MGEVESLAPIVDRLRVVLAPQFVGLHALVLPFLALPVDRTRLGIESGRINGLLVLELALHIEGGSIIVERIVFFLLFLDILDLVYVGGISVHVPVFLV